MEKNVEPLTVACGFCNGTGTRDAKQCEVCTGSGKRRIRMDAYYYGFGLTGVAEIDVLLSAVACAGKAFHHTESWGDECSPYHERHRGNSPVDWIQNAAEDAAAKFSAAEQDNKRLREALGKCTGYLLNAKIDIETGAPRKTALATIEGGLNMARAALQPPAIGG